MTLVPRRVPQTPPRPLFPYHCMAALTDPAAAAPLVPAFNAFDFATPKLAAKLRAFSVAWDATRADALAGDGSHPNHYPNLMDDPLLTPAAAEDREALLKRYLIAEDFALAKSIERLEATLRFRRDWDVIALHQPGAARRVLTEECNPGCEAYFTHTEYTDKGGAPLLVARLVLCSSDNTHPWRHLRAAVFVCERAALKMKHPVQAGAYIVDCNRPVSDAPMEWRASYSCTHGGNGGPQATKANPNRATRGAGKEAGFALDELWNGGVSVTDKKGEKSGGEEKSPGCGDTVGAAAAAAGAVGPGLPLVLVPPRSAVANSAQPGGRRRRSCEVERSREGLRERSRESSQERRARRTGRAGRRLNTNQ